MSRPEIPTDKELLYTVLQELREIKSLLLKEHKPMAVVPTTPLKPPKMPFTGLFERFWGEYPRKVGKMAAFRAWKTHAPNDENKCLELIDAVKKQREWPDWTKEGGKFIPHPATWLNQHRWLDEPREENNGRGAGKYGGLGEVI